MADAAALKAIACEAIDNCSSELRQVNTKIWEHPELSAEEKYAHKLLTDFLAGKGFNVTPHWTLETAFSARSGGEYGPCIGVICEYDALPEVGHACGHNLIAEAGAAAGIGISAALASTNNKLGSVLILGTPAEEAYGGKINMIDSGCFKGVDYCMMAHPTPVDSTLPAVLASHSGEVTYHGHSAHSAAFPWEGVNALDAAVLAYAGLSTLRQQMKPTWRLASVILEGGVNPCIIPDRTRMMFECRAPTIKELSQVKEKAVACLEGAAKATGCALEIEWHANPYSDLASNLTMAALYQANAESLGIQFPSLEEQKTKVLGSTDMGNVSHVVPSIHPIYGIGSKAVNHSHAFTAVAGSDVAHERTLIAGKAMAMTAVDLLCSSEVQGTVKREFAELQ